MSATITCRDCLAFQNRARTFRKVVANTTNSERERMQAFVDGGILNTTEWEKHIDESPACAVAIAKQTINRGIR